MQGVAEDLRDASPEASDDSSPRICAWCTGPIRRAARRDAITCSKRCRQAKARFRVEACRPTSDATPRRFGYADPPYPGLARRYYGCAEVDHRALVAQLEREFPDGWALSTSARALPDVLRLITVPVRIGAWIKGSRPGVSYFARSAWEPVIVAGGRPRRMEPQERLDDVLLGFARQRTHPGALVGMKPAAFASWLFQLLGAAPCDELVDLFPGSGAIGRAWALFRRASTRDASPPPATATAP